MKLGSKRYRGLVARLNDLQKHLLAFLSAPPVSKVQYSEQELDFTRAYVVLAHAEIEAFCEDLASAKASAARDAYNVSGKIRPTLRRLISYLVAKNGKSWQLVLSPTAEIINAALQSHADGVKNNHGVRRMHIEKLFFQLGVHEARLDPTWLLQMDTFGSTRGGWAHSSIKTQQPPDPLSELNNVLQLLPGLKGLDESIGKLN